MIPFDYTMADSVEGAVRSGTVASTRYVAGGTTLIDLMKLGVERPTHVVDLNPLVRRDASLGGVADLPNGGLRLGGLAHMSDVAWDARVRERYPMVSQSLLLAASGQVRNMATMAGNILQRTRCPYFRDTATACNKREPGTGCSAIHGINRGHAVLGTSEHCIATHPSDLAVALTALDAVVQVRGSSGARAIPFAELHVLPGGSPPRRRDYLDRHSASRIRATIAVLEGARPRELRVCACFGGRRPRCQFECDSRSACGARRRRHKALALARSGTPVDRATRNRSNVPRGR